MDCYIARCQEHKEEARSRLEYYKKLALETESSYKHIQILQEQHLTQERSSELQKLKESFSAFISADYMMGKNLLHWGESINHPRHIT